MVIFKEFLKFIFLKIRLAKFRANGAKLLIGPGTYIAKGCFASRGREIQIGKNCYIGRNVSLSCNLELGNDVLIASSVAFVGGDHRFDGIEGPMISSGRDEIKTIRVEDDVWIGHGAIILHGIKLGTGCIVAAGAVVTKDVDSFAIVGGNPAKLIRKRKNKL